MAKFKVVYYVEEYDETQPGAEPPVKRVIIPRQQIIVEFDEFAMAKADANDADKIKAGIAIGENYILYQVYGRGRYIKEMWDACGIMIARHLRSNLARRLGETRYMELMPPDLKSKLVPLETQ